MTKPSERVEEMNKQIANIDAEISGIQKKAATVQAELEDRLARLREKMAERDHIKQKLIRDREREAADAAALDWMDGARALDKHGDSPERLHKFERAGATLAFAGRLSMPRYEARKLNYDRMRRMGDGAMFRPPFTSWSKLAEAWLRPAPEERAA
jgi:hypothetical protein